ncbi:hypothetical protein BDBG_06134 [Blastomyces gilchristii SLH14081]|uniref:tRNA-specific adenosine-34 deaminase subunit Tad3 n=1 Tax=Blastomyces gilchristii (strain SLH14081) TaxID=559298 RepID=A0A179USW5_BLAGS|nr:uncharacterized protein BDBG_06134 [Blastomyces gilchristii SLH14081]OAT11186.1 hypothetical protein BDBG_06134 [Blastomyces gilchristii SLH14081]
MEILNPFKDIQPLRGQVSLLKTVQETRSGKDTVEAYVAEINIKSASKVLKLLESKSPKDPSLSLTHLRRFVKPEFLPEHLKRDSAAAVEGEVVAASKSSQTIYILIPPPLPELSLLETLLAPYAPISASSDASSAPDAAASVPAPISPIEVQSIRIPLSPPTTEEESVTWSRTLWPTIFNPAAHPITHSPRGPLLLDAQESVSRRAGNYLALARNRGRGRRGSAAGEMQGKVGAGAAPSTSYDPDNEGQPDHHALMRAISLVAYKRLTSSTSPTVTPSISMSPPAPASVASTPGPLPAVSSSTEPSTSSPPPSKKPKPSPQSLDPEPIQPTQPPRPLPYPPLTPLEFHFLSLPNIQTRTQGGYLCTSLDLYITHEPCVCCAMGMLLSRFRAVVYLQATGPGRADAALDPYTGYGLHWRQELNWRVVGFRFCVEGEDGAESKEEREGLEGLELERGVFHA